MNDKGKYPIPYNDDDHVAGRSVAEDDSNDVEQHRSDPWQSWRGSSSTRYNHNDLLPTPDYTSDHAQKGTIFSNYPYTSPHAFAPHAFDQLSEKDPDSFTVKPENVADNHGVEEKKPAAKVSGQDSFQTPLPFNYSLSFENEDDVDDESTHTDLRKTDSAGTRRLLSSPMVTENIHHQASTTTRNSGDFAYHSSMPGATSKLNPPSVTSGTHPQMERPHVKRTQNTHIRTPSSSFFEYCPGYDYTLASAFSPENPAASSYVEKPPATPPHQYYYPHHPVVMRVSHHPVFHFDSRRLHSNQYAKTQDELHHHSRLIPSATIRPSSTNTASIAGLTTPSSGKKRRKIKRPISFTPYNSSHDTAPSSIPEFNRKPPPQPLTGSGERTSERQLHPSEEELREAKTPRAKGALHNFYSRLAELYHFKDIHGHTNVPQKYPQNPTLGIWVNKQRMEMKFRQEGKQSSMTDAKIRALEAANFVWAKRKGQTAWNEKYAQLLAYYVKKGNCNVPTKHRENRALGRWVSTQRSQYKKYKQGQKSNMTEERIQKLEEIGFSWCMLPIGSDKEGKEDSSYSKENDHQDSDQDLNDKKSP